jgi:hypothetical protein
MGDCRSRRTLRRLILEVIVRCQLNDKAYFFRISHCVSPKSFVADRLSNANL